MSHTMLYKYPGPHEIHGGKFDHIVVSDEEVDAAVAAGWFLTTPEAKAAHTAAEAAKKAAQSDPLADLTGGASKPAGKGDAQGKGAK